MIEKGKKKKGNKKQEDSPEETPRSQARSQRERGEAGEGSAPACPQRRAAGEGGVGVDQTQI